jgi:hypothetical protein
MKWKSLLLGFTTGFFAAAVLLSRADAGLMRPDRILKRMKDHFRTYGQITGSWILETPEWFSSSDQKIQVYRGGVTVLQDGARKTFEFLSDATTGNLLESRMVQ